MNKYAQSAIRAVGLCNEFNTSPIDAWEQATSEYFEKGSDSQQRVVLDMPFCGYVKRG